MKRTFFAMALLAFAAAANATLTVLPGSSPQRVRLGETFAPIRVQVTNSLGQPVVGKRVSYSYVSVELQQQSTEGCEAVFLGSAYGCSSLSATDSQGVVQLPPLKATMAKSTPSLVQISAAEEYPGERYGTVIAELSADPLGPAKKVTIVSGSNQRAAVGQVFSQPFVVRVTTLDDRPVAGVSVTFIENRFSTGEFSNGAHRITVNTDAEGMASSGPFKDPKGIKTGTVQGGAIDPDSNLFVPFAPISYFNTTADGRDELALQDIWWSGAEESGWGFTVAQRQDRLFAVLFAYDSDGNPTWQVLPDTGWESRFERALLYLYAPHGSPYFAYDASRFDLGRQVRPTRITIASEQSLRMDLLNNPLPTVRQTKELARHPFARPDVAPLQGVGGIWWGGPSQAGWGLSITEHPGALFCAWYTYDANGNATWFVMPEGSWQDENTYAGPIYKTHSSPWFDTAYDVSRLQVTAVGTFRLRFQDRAHATFEWTAEGHAGSTPISPLEF